MGLKFLIDAALVTLIAQLVTVFILRGFFFLLKENLVYNMYIFFAVFFTMLDLSTLFALFFVIIIYALADNLFNSTYFDIKSIIDNYTTIITLPVSLFSSLMFLRKDSTLIFVNGSKELTLLSSKLDWDRKDIIVLKNYCDNQMYAMTAKELEKKLIKKYNFTPSNYLTLHSERDFLRTHYVDQIKKYEKKMDILSKNMRSPTLSYSETATMRAIIRIGTEIDNQSRADRVLNRWLLVDLVKAIS